MTDPLKNLVEEFKGLDADQDGLISREEFMQFLRPRGVREVHAELAFQKADGDADGYINEEEAAAAAQEALSGS